MVNVFLNNQAYARVRAAKKEGESVSDVVLRYVPQDLDVSEYFGSCKGLDADRANAKIRQERAHR